MKKTTKIMKSLFYRLVSTCLAVVITFLCSVISFKTNLNTNISAVAATNITVKYKAHCADIGWQNGWKSDGEIAGTVGKSKRLECLKISLSGVSSSDKISVQTHLANIGWSKWASASNSKQLTSGTTGQSRAIEAIKIKLSGRIAEQYDIFYRVHVENLGWLSWVKNGQVAGTTGRALRTEAIQIKLEPKTTNYKTVTLGDFSTVEQWQKEVQKAMQTAVGIGKYVPDYNGGIRNYGDMILGVEAVEYKTMAVTYDKYGSKVTEKFKFPSKLRFKIHKHNTQQIVLFTFSKLTVTQHCSCGKTYNYKWDVPLKEITCLLTNIK